MHTFANILEDTPWLAIAIIILLIPVAWNALLSSRRKMREDNINSKTIGKKVAHLAKSNPISRAAVKTYQDEVYNFRTSPSSAAVGILGLAVTVLFVVFLCTYDFGPSRLEKAEAKRKQIFERMFPQPSARQLAEWAEAATKP
jgi:hypothetical protein